jgi:hypothetical protein
VRKIIEIARRGDHDPKRLAHPGMKYIQQEDAK